MWEERAYRARRDIAELAASGLGVSDLHAAAISLIDDKVGTDLTCWATIDPEMLVISTMTSGEAQTPRSMNHCSLNPSTQPTNRIPLPLLCIAGNRWPSCRICPSVTAIGASGSTKSGGRWGRSRTSRVVPGRRCVLGRCRHGAVSRDFTDRETDFLTAVAPAIASATRLAVRSEARGWGPNGHPAIVLVGSGGEVSAVTPAAGEWRERLDQIAPGRPG